MMRWLLLLAALGVGFVWRALQELENFAIDNIDYTPR